MQFGLKHSIMKHYLVIFPFLLFSDTGSKMVIQSLAELIIHYYGTGKSNQSLPCMLY
jgi:hypothetical protein